MINLNMLSGFIYFKMLLLTGEFDKLVFDFVAGLTNKPYQFENRTIVLYYHGNLFKCLRD